MAVHIDLSLEDMESDHLTDQPEVCEVCYLEKPGTDFHEFRNCHHRFCTDCIRLTYHGSIVSSRVNIQCLQCKAELHPEEVKALISPELYEQYLNLSLRKYLSTIPEVRYCQSPDCPFACILAKHKSRGNSNRTEDRHFVCQRAECGKEYCNDCKLAWHPDKTCSEARAEAPESETIPEVVIKELNVKPCPNCKSMIEKLDDGTCNEVICAVCHTSFCWLCMQPVSEMHFLSPTGCPMYGNHRWTRRKRYCCRLWMWLLAPYLTLLIAIILLPIVVVALPILVAHLVKDSRCTRDQPKCRRILIVTISVIVTLLLSPPIALLCSVFSIPLLLFYAYCFVPVQVCMQTGSE